VRVSTLFNRILGLSGASVASVAFTADGLVLGLRRPRRRRLLCPCGTRTWGRYDSSRRRWRHLDFGACRVWLEADVYRVDCAGCGTVRTEQVPWARPGARHTRDFEDVVVWLAQRMDKAAVSRLLRCSWEAVDRIAKRVVVEHIDDARLDGLLRIGVDEISYKRGHRYLTIVADHDTGRVVWIGQQRDRVAFEQFFDALGDRRAGQLEAITLDASKAYLGAARERAPQATLCLDPFHVIKWCNEALEAVFRAHTPQLAAETGYKPSRRNWRRARYAVMAGAEKLDADQRAFVNLLRRHRYRLYRAWELKEQLRGLYQLDHPEAAAGYLKKWITHALLSRIPAYRILAARLRKHFDAIIAAVQLGLSNSRLEGINSKIRVIQRRGYGFRDVDSLTAMIYLCIGGITITLPTQR
jgi:transposase